MKRPAFVLLMLFLVAGCESIPFKKTLDEPYSSVDPAAVREQFQARIPKHLRLLNTIVFEYNWQTFSAIGFVDVDTAERTCTLVSINQMGVKLFELSIDKDSVNTLFALPEFTAKGNFGKTVGEDIKRIYFNLVPSKEAEVDRKTFSILFRQQEGEGTAEYVFSGQGYYLTEKTYYEKGTPVYRVSFYEYLNKDGMIYPGGTDFEEFPVWLQIDCKIKGNLGLSIKREVENYMTVLEASADGVLTARFTFPDEFVGFQGHFPSGKVLPGVCQIQCVASMLEKTGKAFLLKEIISAKFVLPVLPHEEIVCVCSRIKGAPEDFVVKASVSRGGQVVSELKLRGLIQEKNI